MSISEYAVEFNRIEAEIFSACCKQGREALKAVLEACDAELAESRERGKYRHKGYRKTTIKTIMGEVEYRRSIYEVREEGAQKRFVYLLDEAMGKEGVGTMIFSVSRLLIVRRRYFLRNRTVYGCIYRANRGRSTERARR